MLHPEGAGSQRADRVDFDPHVRLEFRGAQISSDGGLLVMRELDDALELTAIQPQTERKRLDRSVHRAEKRCRQATMTPVHGLIRPAPAVCATTDAVRGEKRLFNRQNQAIRTSDGRPLGVCRLEGRRMNRVTKRIGFFLLWILSTATGPAMAERLAGSEWRPVELNGATQPDDTRLSVQFGTNGRTHGFSGCNRFMGHYSTNGRRIKIGPLASTRMACEETAMQTETRFLKMLEATTEFEREQVRLVLRDENRAILARFAQTDWD